MKAKVIMGLDFSHTNAQWSYSGFMRFRERLAEEIGIDLNKMEGFNKENDYKGLSWEKIVDPIKYLLDHSDCEDDLSPELCSKVAPRLRELVSSWDDDDYDKEQALLLAEGMELAFSKNEPLEFE
jgi:hypothetical protein